MRVTTTGSKGTAFATARKTIDAANARLLVDLLLNDVEGIDDNGDDDWNSL